MSELLNSSTGSYLIKQIEESWAESGILDGLVTNYTGSMAQLMESEAMQLLIEEGKIKR
jgi:hypothetical protein